MVIVSALAHSLPLLPSILFCCDPVLAVVVAASLLLPFDSFHSLCLLCISNFFSSFISNETKIGSFCIGLFISELALLFVCTKTTFNTFLINRYILGASTIAVPLTLLLPLPALFNSDWWSWPACSTIWFINVLYSDAQTKDRQLK